MFLFSKYVYSKKSKQLGSEHVKQNAALAQTTDGDWNDIADILGIDFDQQVPKGKTHPYGAQMLETMGFQRFNPALAKDDDEDGNTV